jgi:hypothetical protein
MADKCSLPDVEAVLKTPCPAFRRCNHVKGTVEKVWKLAGLCERDQWCACRDKSLFDR